MKKLLIAAALGLGVLFTTAASAQTQTPPDQVNAHKTTAPGTRTKATPPRDAKGHFTKPVDATPTTAKPANETKKPAVETAKPKTVRQRDAKGRFVKAEATKPATEKSTSKPRDSKGRFIKKTDTAAPASK